MAALETAVGRAFYGQFSRLRPAQAAAVEACGTGDDIVVLAGTGSGKTEAVVAPLVSRYLPDLAAADQPLILYVAPTRALVNDVFRRLDGPFEQLGVRVGIRHGERNDLDKTRKPAVLITTPESVDVLLFKSAGVLSKVRAVVIDEAHLLYNTQRGFQLAILLNRLELAIGHSVQVAAMSATVADPKALWSFFRPGHVPQVVNDPSSRPIRRTIRLGWSKQKLAETLTDIRDDRPAGVKALVFTESRAECDALAAELRADSRFDDAVFAHHSSLSRQERELTEARFQELRSAVCVATTTLELGIDIGDIDVVVLWGRATGWESFLQRVGRGNRRSDEVQVICVVPEDLATVVPAMLGFQALLNQVEVGTIEAPMPLELFGAACQQVMSIALAKEGGYVRRSQFAEAFAPWPHLSTVAVDRVVDELVNHELLQRHPLKSSWVGPTQGAYELVDRMEVWSNFPLSAREMSVYEGTHLIGRIPGQNLLMLDTGKTFTLGALRYEIHQVRGDRIDVRRTTAPPQVRLRYGGAGITLDPTLVEAEWQLLVSGNVSRDVGSPAKLNSMIAALGELIGAPALTVPVWSELSGFVYLTCAGRRMNQLLAMWLGGDPKASTELTVALPHELDLSALPTKLEDFGDNLADVASGEAAERTIFQNLLPVDLLRREALDTWFKTPVYARTLRRLAASSLRPVPAPFGVEWSPPRGRRA